MSKEKIDAIVKKTDAVVKRFDAFTTKRHMKKDAMRRRMADARMAAGQQKLDASKTVDDAFEEDDSDDEDDCNDSQMDPGKLSKRDPL
jgi:hypothetical protein